MSANTKKVDLKGLNKRGSSNFSVDKIQLMVALRTSVFVSESNEVEPNKRVCVK